MRSHAYPGERSLAFLFSEVSAENLSDLAGYLRPRLSLLLQGAGRGDEILVWPAAGCFWLHMKYFADLPQIVHKHEVKTKWMSDITKFLLEVLPHRFFTRIESGRIVLRRSRLRAGVEYERFVAVVVARIIVAHRSCLSSLAPLR